MPLLRAYLLKVIALPHVDYVLALWRFVSAEGRGLLCTATNKVLRRALSLHSRCSTNLVCAVADTVPTSVRAGQLMVRSATVAAGIGADCEAVIALRSAGISGRIAASTVFKELISSTHAERSRCIRILLRNGDLYARAMAFNISVPSALRF